MIIARFQNGKETRESVEWRRRHYRNAIVWFVLIVVFFIVGTISTFAQFGQGVAAGAWEPRNYKTKLGLVADWDPGNVSQVTLNGAGVSQILDRSWQTGRLENLLVQSETFATTWVRARVNAFGVDDSGLTNAGSFANTARTTDPLGGNTADFIQEDATATQTHNVSVPFVTSGGMHTFSVYAKPAGRSWVRLRVQDSITNQFQGWFDVQNGVVGTVTYGGTYTNAVGAISASANGFYLVSVTGNIISPIGPGAIIYTSTGDGINAYSGNSTDGLFIWGAQLRRSTSSSTYVATVATAEDSSRSLNQTTAGNQPLISRADNKGNLLVQSETFATTWTRARINAFGVDDSGLTNAGSFANTARTTDPLGGNTADFIQEDNTATNSHSMAQTTAILPAGSYVYECDVKPGGRTWSRLALYGNTSAGLAWAHYDSQNGVVGASGASSGFTLGSVTITASANGFYRCRLTATTATSETLSVLIYPAVNGTSGGISYNGDSTSGLFIWGASLRQSSWDSDYIPTVATISVPGLNGRKTAYFDGAAHYLKTPGIASLVQPETVIWCGKQVTWTLTDAIWDGYTSGNSRFYQSATTPNVRLAAPTLSTEVTNATVGSWVVATSIYNSTNSSLEINLTSPTVSDAGTNGLQGLTLGARGDGGVPANIQVARVLVSQGKTLATNELEYLRHGPLKMVGAR